MALKPLQSAHYPPTEPKLQTGLTKAELDADYRRLETALRKTRVDVEEAYAQTQAWVRRPFQSSRARR
jgi:hypothetical protein